MAYIRHGNRRYPLVTRVQCLTCASVHRARIERLTIDGLSPGQIARRLPDGHGVSQQSIYRHHRRGHMPADNAMVARRQEIRAEQRWEELGLDATAFKATEADVAQLVLEVVADRLRRGVLHFEAMDGLRAARFLSEIERAEQERNQAERLGQWRLDRAIEDIVRVIEIVGEVAGDAVRNEVVRRACKDAKTALIMSTTEFAVLRVECEDEEAGRESSLRSSA